MNSGSTSAISNQRVSPLPKWKLGRVRRFVDENLAGRLPLDRLACAAGLSPMHFAAQFRLATGMRPSYYVTHCRIERAKQLIARSEWPLHDVARMAGFQDPAHFSTVFKRFTGHPPRAYRSALRNGANRPR